MSEQWRVIPGYPKYEVSDLGRVKSLRYRNKDTPNLLTCWPNVQTGYLMVKLGNKYPTVHSLVLLAFCGPRPANCPEIRHLDGTRTNNALTNLRYASRSENRLDTIAHGRDHNVIKAACPSGHPYDAENTYTVPSRPNWRYCRACRNTADVAQCELCGVSVLAKGLARHRRTMLHARNEVAA